MGHLTRATIKRLTALYLVGQFPKGVYSNFRYQKVLYYALAESDKRPFTFLHTQYGMYSKEPKNTLLELVACDLLKVRVIDRGAKPGSHWMVIRPDFYGKVAIAMERFSSKLRSAIDSSVKQYGFIRGEELNDQVHEDDAIRESGMYDALLEENIRDLEQIDLDEDDCEDLELALNPEFLSGMSKIIEGFEDSGFDLDQVKQVESIV